ncbi:MAG: type I-G CRISPR-associated protein Csb2 [Syntrophales bacterium]
MSEYLCITIHFLGDEFHGRGDQGEPEWPPSPLRLFQALVATSARLGGQTWEALRWLEQQPSPVIIAPKHAEIQPKGYKTYVPDNVGDIVANSWSRGSSVDKDNHAIDISGYRTEKFVRPTRLEDGTAVHYLWKTDDSAKTHAPALVSAARAISQFGWGIDLVVADAALVTGEDAAKLSGERWMPSEALGGRPLRVPAEGTFDDLKQRYAAFLNRIRLDSPTFKPVPPIATFTVRTYRREHEMSVPPYAIFALRKPDDSGFTAFDPVRRALHLGGMLRCVAKQSDFTVSLGWDEKKVASFVLGHEEEWGDVHRPVNGARLVFIPLPSIEWRGAEKGRAVGAVRRVLVTVNGEIDNIEFTSIVRNLEGRELVDEKTGQITAFLRRQSDDDGAISRYFAQSSAWVTVTPVILPGYDDSNKLRRRLNSVGLTAKEKADIVLKLEARIDSLLRKALRQAGYPEELAKNAELQWRGSGFIKGTDLAGNYAVPDQHRRYRRLHVRILWRDPEGKPLKISGPICVGGGRFSGLGLFAASDEGAHK